MDRPMRALGPTIPEIVLSDVLAILGPLLVAWAVASAIVPGTLLPDASVGGGLLAAGTAGAGIALALAGAGLRQNRVTLDLGSLLLPVVGVAWLAWGIVAGRPASIAAGAVFLALGLLTLELRRQAIRARFTPRFFSPRAFETMVAIADTMIDGDGREAAGPIDVAIRTDHLLAEVRSAATEELKLVMVLVEWVLPLLILRPPPFTALGSFQRRRAVEKVIGAGGPLRDVARSLKVLACAGYYGNPDTMRRIGYRPFDERPRAAGVDQTPLVHPDPFAGPPVASGHGSVPANEARVP